MTSETGKSDKPFEIEAEDAYYHGPCPDEFAALGIDPNACATKVPVADQVLYPYRTVGLLTYTKPSGSTGYGTAFAIGRNYIMTAAHCVCEEGTNNLNTNFRFYPASVGRRNAITQPFGEWQSTGTPVVMPEWHSSNTKVPKAFDAAIIELKSNAAGKKLEEVVGKLEVVFEKKWNLTQLGMYQLDAIGYPGTQSACPKIVSGEMQIQRGVLSFHQPKHRLGRDGRMGKGASGGPWLHFKSTPQTPQLVYGLTSNSQHKGVNYSPKFNKNMKKYFKAHTKNLF